MSAAAVIARRRRQYVERYRAAGATAPERSVAPSALGIRTSWVFDRMAQAGVFVPVSDGRFYLDENAAAVYFRRSKERALIMTGIALVVFLVVLVVFGR